MMSTSHSSTDQISSREAAGLLGYTVQHVRRLIRQGTLDGFKLGRDWIVRRESVDEYLARRANLNLPLGPDRD